jgi:hypothetical protein
MSKVSLQRQIEIVERCVTGCVITPNERNAMIAALATLRLFQKYEPELRDLLSLCIKRDEELPGSEIRVLTPSDHGSSATSQEGSVEPAALREGGK